MTQFTESFSNQLTSLKKKQRELELVAQIVEAVGAITDKETEHKEVANRIKDLFTSFANRAIQTSETLVTKVQIVSGHGGGSTEVRVSEKGAGVPDNTPQNLPPTPPAGDIGSKIKFGLAYRHLANARVKVGDQEGIVHGIDAPHIIVITDDNQALKVSPDQLVILQGRKSK